jgi:hypothetical protein
MSSILVPDNSFTTAFNSTLLAKLIVLHYTYLYHNEFNTFFRILTLSNGSLLR